MKFFLLVLFSLPVIAQDEYFSRQWYLKNEGQEIRRDLNEITSRVVHGKAGSDIGFPFDLNMVTGREVVVAILDTGIDIDHPELKSSISISKQECDSLGNLPPRSSPDRDGNSLGGDCAGWNFASSISDKGDNQVWDDVGHGTHLAGLISARMDESGIRGISDKIRILPVKIFSKYEVPNHPQRPKLGMMKRIIKGLEYAIDKNVDIINLSLGWPKFLDSREVRELIKKAARKNILIVAAAGNNAHHTTIYPCSYESVLCVGATTVNGELAPFSNFGGNVDMLAPGENILSTIPKKITPLYFDEDGFDYKNGTSQSAPLVAGSAALIKMVYPQISTEELKARLFNSASKTQGKLDSLYGSLNLTRALTEAPEVLIYPEIKELNTIEVKYPSGNFSFKFPLRSFTGIETQFDIEVSIPQIQVETKREDGFIVVNGNISDLQLNSTQIMALTIKYDGRTSYFNKEITFALDPFTVSERVSFNENVTGLKTAEDPFYIAEKTIFYTINKFEGGYDLIFYNVKGDIFEKYLALNKTENNKLVAVTALTSSLVGIEFYDETNKKLIYEFWNMKRYPTLEKTVSMEPDSSLWEMGKASYLSLSKIKAATLNIGHIPVSEKETSVFVSPDNSKGLHAYYFKEEEGTIKTYLLDNKFFRNSLKSRYSLRFNDEIFPVAILSSGQVDRIHVSFAVGKGFERKLIEVAFKDRNDFVIVKEETIPAAFAFKNYNFLGQNNLMAQEKKDGYLAFVNGLIERYNWSDENDDLLGPITLLSRELLLAQTQNHFVVLNEKGVVHKTPLKRFSFLPGELFSELFVPVLVNNNGNKLPALFVDATLISEKHISVIFWNGSKLVRPVLFQQNVPDECQVLNPQRLSENFVTMLLCHKENKSFVLRRTLRFR